MLPNTRYSGLPWCTLYSIKPYYLATYNGRYLNFQQQLYQTCQVKQNIGVSYPIYAYIIIMYIYVAVLQRRILSFFLSIKGVFFIELH